MLSSYIVGSAIYEIGVTLCSLAVWEILIASFSIFPWSPATTWYVTIFLVLALSIGTDVSQIYNNEVDSELRTLTIFLVRAATNMVLYIILAGIISIRFDHEWSVPVRFESAEYRANMLHTISVGNGVDLVVLDAANLTIGRSVIIIFQCILNVGDYLLSTPRGPP